MRPVILLILLTGSAAAADLPDRVAGQVATGAGSADRLAVAPDGSLVALVSGSSAYVLDVGGWEATAVGTCSATAVAIAQPGSQTELYVGCSDGTVLGLAWSDRAASALTGGDGGELEIEVAAGGEIGGLWWDGDDSLLYALAWGSDDSLSLYEIDPDSETVGGPVTLLRDGYIDAAVQNGILYVLHDGDELTNATLGGSTAGLINTTYNVDLRDVAPRPAGGAYLADNRNGWVMNATPGGTELSQAVIGPSGLRAVGTDDTEGWLIAATDDTAEVYPLEGGVLTPEVEVSFDLPVAPTDIIAGVDGYGYAGGSDGTVMVLTSKPWISNVVATPSAAGAGSEITLGFDVDTAGYWWVRLNGDWQGSGDLVAEASAEVVAGSTVEAVVTVDDAWREGDNELYVFHSADPRASFGEAGHARAIVAVDNPPSQPSLTDANVGFADSALLLAFDGIDDADLDHYDVYVSVTSFDGADWTSGGPAFDGTDDLTTPIEVAASGGDSVELRIEPLTNGQTYYIAVRATDAGGVEGPMSDVVTGTPRPTYSASELSGDPGGAACAVAPAAGGVAAMFMAGLALFGRRRRLAGAAVAVAAGLVAGPDALAADKDKGDATPAWGNAELRFGLVSLEDEDITGVYGKSGNKLLQLEFGPQLFRFLELDFGIGFFQELAWKIDTDGAESSDRTMLTLWPLSASITVRGHIFDEQLIVPFASLGLDWILWDERWDDGAGGKIKTGGAKRGTHFAVGGNLLLDIFDKKRASQLEVQTGINDSWLTFEWRRQWANPPVDGGGTGLSFSHSAFMFGLKLDY